MGGLIRTLFTLAIIVIVGAYFLGYLPKTASIVGSAPGATQAPVSPPDVEKTKEPAAPTPAPTGDDLRDRAALAAARIDSTLADTTLTAKIKAKIALDDTVKAAEVSVHSKSGVVTVGGAVGSAAVQQRILQLARETAGVKSVVNETTIAGKS
jgi:hypothetical protein